MSYPTLYRKRLIPEECVMLKDDEILRWDDEIIVTKWNSLKPKIDLHHGFSCYCLKEGYKVSEFYREDGSLLYWYCDIVTYEPDETGNKLYVLDLLADVIIYPDGKVKVVDLDELVTCLDEKKITIEQLKKAITQLDKLLRIIYAGKLNTITDMIDKEKR